MWTGLAVASYGAVCLVYDLATQSGHTTLAFVMVTVAGLLMIGLRFLTNQAVTPRLNLPHIGRRHPPYVPPIYDDNDPPWNG